MGHTWDVHKDFYRQYDPVGERLEVAKLLMLQDQNKLNDYRDKNLGEIDVEQLARAQFKESSSDNNHVSITPPPQLRDNLFDTFQYLTPASFIDLPLSLTMTRLTKTCRRPVQSPTQGPLRPSHRAPLGEESPETLCL